MHSIGLKIYFSMEYKGNALTDLGRYEEALHA